MTLNKAQQQEWDILIAVLKATSRVCSDISLIKEEMKLWIADFERFVNHDYKVKIINGSELELNLVDCSRDSLKASVDALPSVTLRARNEGIQVMVKASYKDNYSFSNAQIAESLRTLAARIESADVEIHTLTEDTDLMPSVDRTLSVADEPVDELDEGFQNEEESEIQADQDDNASKVDEPSPLSDGAEDEALSEEYGERLMVLESAPEDAE